MKIRAGLIMVVLVFLSSVCAYAAEIQTISADNVTYYGATLHGYISDTDKTVTSYGFELWADNGAKQKIQQGTGTYNGYFESKCVMPDDTVYHYRTYIIDKASKYYYGEEATFKTDKRKAEQPPAVSFNINVEAPDSIDFENNPNKFFLNNLIVNQREKLQLIAGNSFDGVEGVEQSGGQNIFLNQHFINHYYSDPLLRSALTVFDGLVYNRDDWVNEIVTSNVICDAAIRTVYNISDSTFKDTIRSVYSDMRVKRFSGAINNVIDNEYTSSDKRTFGYDKGNYRMLNAVADGSKTAKKTIRAFSTGEEKLVSGIENYQEYYFDKIAPAYTNASNNYMGMSKYLNSNWSSLSDAQRAANLESYYSYIKEVHTYDRLGFVDEKAGEWKYNLESKWFGEETKTVLDQYGKILSFTDASLGTVKAIDQVTRNKEQLEGTFERLRNTTANKKLQITLDDYLYKMNNNTGDFIVSTAGNIYNVFAKKKITKALNEEIKSEGMELVASTNGLYTAQVTDKVLADANYVLIAADAGGFFAEQAMNTKTILEKAIELKYLWNIENESKVVLYNDVSSYAQNQTEANAEAVMNDLFWIKALKLREITSANAIYKANGNNWVSLADKSLKEVADGVDKIFTSQRDALVNAELTESAYTTETLKLVSGETYQCFASDNAADGSMAVGGKTTILKNARARLAGGVEIASGAALNLMNAGGTTYIPYIRLASGGQLVINNSNVIIGELTVNGTAVISGNTAVSECVINSGTMTADNLTVNGLYTQNDGTVNVGSGTLRIKNDMVMKKGSINGGTTEIGGNADISGTITGMLNAYGDVKSSSAKIGTFNIYGIQPQTLSGQMTVDNLTFANSKSVAITGTTDVKGLLTNVSTKLTGGRNVRLLSGGKIGGTYYNSDLTLYGASVENVTFAKTLYTSGTSAVSGVTVNNMLSQSGTLNLNGDITVKGDAYINGTVSGTEHTLMLYGDLAGSSAKISSLTACSSKPQNITSAVTVTDFCNKNTSFTGLNVGASVTVNGRVHSERAMQNGRNIMLSSTGSFRENTYTGEITLNGLSGNLPSEFIGNIYTNGGVINLTSPSVIKGKMTLSGTTLNINDTTLSVNGTYSGGSNVRLTNAQLILNSTASPGGNVSLTNSTLTSNKIMMNSSTLTVDENSNINIVSDATNSGKITGRGSVSINGDFVNSGTVDIGTFNIDTKKRDIAVSGNEIKTEKLNISGGRSVNLTQDINVSGNYSNDNTSVDDNKIILPFDENAPLKSLTSTTGYTLSGKTVVVNGNCTVSGGVITLTNGARLVINGIFRASGTTFSIDETSEIIVKQYSFISSFTDISNNGKMSFGSDVSLTSTKLGGNGEYILLGDMYMSSASINKPNIFTISGGTPQKLWGGTMDFNNLNIKNTSSGGVEFGSAASYYGTLINEAIKVSGTLTKAE